MTETLQQALAGFDAANALDPHHEVDEHGQMHPKELLYARRMTDELERFIDAPSEHLQLAARAQHIERWTSARTDYPEGRTGYKQWRAELGLYHAKRAGEIMAAVGYSEDDIKRVQYLVQKRQLKRDPETQALEDVICLVFLRHYIDEFAAKHEEDKIIDIIQKTWKKMSENGHAAALKIPFSEKTAKILKKSLNF
ncbi:hypothetical protein TDB9533_04288 [Thalassocella blandensis]|nr:hypothetical protein TDB9533_04288 [Thalassocella blandensis]